MAIEEKISNSGATVRDTKNLQESTGAEILDNSIQTIPSAEQVIPIIPPEVQRAGIKAVLPPHHEMLSGSEVHAGSVDGSNITIIPTRAALETQAIKARTEIKGPDDSGKRWRTLTQVLAEIKNRFQHPQIETLPDNVTPISQAKSFGNAQQQEQITGPALIASAEQELPKAT